MAYFTVTSRLPPRPPSPWIHRASLTDTNYLLFCTSALIGCLGLFTPFFFFSSFASSIGLSRELAFAATSVLNGGAVLGRIIPSLLADKLGRFNIFIVSGVLTGLTVLCLWTTVNNAVGMMWLAALYGFFSGSVVSLVGPCVAQISPIELIGQRLGVFYMFCSIS
jgi:MFS family permease